MKLYITRNQSTGMFGGVNFELYAKVELTSNESDVVSRYRLEKEVLLHKEMKIPLTDNAISLDITVGGLVNGQNFKCKHITEVLEYERNLKEACELFKDYIMVMSSFGGQEVIEF